jgi:hypothetical protein
LRQNDDDDDVRAAGGWSRVGVHCREGWTQMLCAMKAYIEYGINLREGMFK